MTEIFSILQFSILKEGLSFVLRAKGDFVVDLTDSINDVAASESRAHVVEGIGVSRRTSLFHPVKRWLYSFLPGWIEILANFSK